MDSPIATCVAVFFFDPPTGAYTGLTLEQLALCGGVFLVLVVDGRCICMWWWWLYLRGGGVG